MTGAGAGVAGVAACGAMTGAGVTGSATVGGVSVVGAGVVGAATGGVIVIVGASCAKAAGVERTRNAAIALEAGRGRAIFFIIVNRKRAVAEKRCRKRRFSATSRGREATG